MFKYKRNSQKGLIINHNDLIKLQNIPFPYFYEIIKINNPRKIIFDFDKCNLSFQEIEQLCNDFKIFLQIEYNLPINYNFVYRIHISINDPSIEYNYTYKTFTSIHIFFNVYTETHTQSKQIVSLFKERGGLTQYLDLSIYSSTRLFRCIYNIKEQSYNKETKKLEGIKRTDKFYPFEYTDNKVKVIKNKKGTLLNNEITQFDFATIIKNCFKIHVKETEVEKTQLTEKYNITYKINQTRQLTKYINKIPSIEIEKRDVWFNLAKLIIWYYYLTNKPSQDLFNDKVINLFLQKSKVGKYNNNEYYEHNKIYLLHLINNKTLARHYNNKFIDRLSKTEILFIYENLQLNPTEHIIISTKTYNSQLYLHLSYQNTEALYNPKIQLLITNYITIKDDDNKTTIYSNNQFLLSFYMIEKQKQKKINYPKQVKCNEITSLKIIPTTNKDTYIQAPVGSGKSRDILSRDIIFTLKNPKNKIFMITDSRSLATKQYTDITNPQGQMFYYNLGFEKVGRLDNYMEIEGINSNLALAQAILCKDITCS